MSSAADVPDKVDDDFRQVEGPSIAALHRQWLDRGLPLRTWATWLRQYNEMARDKDCETAAAPVQHSHNATLPCYPACRRWGN